MPALRERPVRQDARVRQPLRGSRGGGGGGGGEGGVKEVERVTELLENSVDCRRTASRTATAATARSSDRRDTDTEVRRDFRIYRPFQRSDVTPLSP